MSIATAARLGGKIVAWLGASILALILLWLGINLVDENLTPLAESLLTAPANPYESSDNLYVGMAGFEAPSQQSMIVVGEARIEAYDRALDAMILDPDKALAFYETPEAGKLAFVGDATSWEPLSSSIWSEAKSHRSDIAKLLASNGELYGRYLALHRMHGYYETARPSYTMPIVYVPKTIRALFLADVANRIQTGTPQQKREALTDLARDVQMWKAELAGTGALVSKMLAAAALQADELLLGDLVTDPTVDLTLLDDDLQAAITPFEIADWKIGNVFAAEMRASAPMMSAIALANSPTIGSSARPSHWWQRAWNVVESKFFKLNATENLDAQQMAQLSALSNADPTGFSEARNQYRSWLKNKENLLTPSIAYNPIGKILVGIGAPAFEAYPMRVYDIAALQRLVFLAYQIRRLGIPAAGVSSFMKEHPEWATHPVDANPLRWDVSSRELSVIPVGNHPKDRRFSLALVFRN
jgi:hypothetical protein